MRILLTGGTGFLGRHLIEALRAHDVFALARDTAAADGRGLGGKRGPADGRIEWIKADLSEGLDVRRLPARMDAIVHLAQSSRFREFPGGAADVFAVNVAAPSVLMQWAVGAGVSRAVFASTGTVYEPFNAPLLEDAAVQPTSFYGASKLAAETLTLAYQAQMAVSQLRVFFLYGPSQTGMLISRLIDTVRQGGAVTLPREGAGLVLAPTFVTDAADVFATACSEGWRGVWNVASPQSVSLLDIVTSIGEISGRPPNIQRSDASPPAPIVPSLAKLRTKVDLDRFVSLDMGLRKTMDRFVAH